MIPLGLDGGHSLGPLPFELFNRGRILGVRLLEQLAAFGGRRLEGRSRLGLEGRELSIPLGGQRLNVRGELLLPPLDLLFVGRCQRGLLLLAADRKKRRRRLKCLAGPLKVALKLGECRQRRFLQELGSPKDVQHSGAGLGSRQAHQVFHGVDDRLVEVFDMREDLGTGGQGRVLITRCGSVWHRLAGVDFPLRQNLQALLTEFDELLGVGLELL